MIEVVEQPTFSHSDFDSRHKKPGLSAIVRLRNEEDFAAATLDSIQPFFDEIVIVFNDCSDRTPEIVEEFACRNPDQVRAFHYVPRVYPPGSEQYRLLPINSAHSLVHYCNFALSKATYQIRCKWDGDQIAEAHSFGRVIRQLRNLKPGTMGWWFSPWRLGYWWYTGINLWDAQQRIWVPKTRPFIGRGHDHGFWPAGRWIIFKHHDIYEYLFTRLLAHRFVGCMFFHLKGMKKDRGTGVYQFDQNPSSPFRPRIEKTWIDPPLETLAEFRTSEPSTRHMPDPIELGIRPIVTR
jgi:glycosyltransferase involved in cell wall biosynthesis